jgi:hypothetical protein
MNLQQRLIRPSASTITRAVTFAIVFANIPAVKAVSPLLLKLTAADRGAVDEFGNSVAIDGQQILIGSHLDDNLGFNSGSAYVFNYPSGQQIYKLNATGGVANDVFAHSVGLSGNKAILGAYLANASSIDDGSAYLFDSTTRPTSHISE